MKIRAILIVGLLSTLSLGASWSENSTAIPKPPVSRSDFRILGFEIENSSLVQIRSKLGYARRFKSTINHDEEGICYISAKDNQTFIEFRTGWPGIWKYLIGFKVSSLTADPIRPKCMKSEAMPDSIATASGLKLGVTRDEIIARFGKPTSSSGEKLIYRWEDIRKMDLEELKAYKKNDPSGVDDVDIGVVTLMEFEFASSKLVSFTIYHTETT